jgi:hypothetical protein
MACEALKKNTEAIEALQKICSLCGPTASDTKKALEKIKVLSSSNANASVQKGFLKNNSSLYSEKEDAAFAKSKEEATEWKWKNMLKKLKNGCHASGRNEKGQKVVLDDGVFAKLLQQEAFQKLIYPGIPKDQLELAPQNLQALLADPWYEEELLGLMPKVQQKAESVLENVKKKAVLQQGEYMDPQTEQMLRPQILQEAFGREIIQMVHRINYKKHLMLTQDHRTIASPQEECAQWDQLSQDFLLQIFKPAIPSLVTSSPNGDVLLPGVAYMDEFMGEEWTELIRKDIDRLIETQQLVKMSAVEEEQQKILYGKTTNTQTSIAGGGGSMRFLDLSECQQSFPALAEAIEKLQALPYEMNLKRQPQVQLCAQFTRSTALCRLQKGDGQRPRLDCGQGQRDNGIKLSCLYFIGKKGAKDLWSKEQTGGLLELGLVRSVLEEEQDEKEYKESPKAQVIEPYNDRLVMFQSQHVYSQISPLLLENQDLCYISFWIHGKKI